MLVALSCACHSAEPLIRRFLTSMHHPDPFSVKIYKAEEAKGWVSKNNLTDIENYLKTRSSYALIAGWGPDKRVHWADIQNSYPAEKIKAQAIVEKFA